jgi:hypothetical protein
MGLEDTTSYLSKVSQVKANCIELCKLENDSSNQPKLRVRGNKLSLNFKECDHCKCIFILHILCPLKNCMHDGEITLGCTEEREREI